MKDVEDGDFPKGAEAGLPGWIVVKNLPANAGDVRDMGLIPGLGRSPGGAHGSPLQYSWRIPWTEEPGGLQCTRSQRMGHDLATNTFTFHFQSCIDTSSLLSH